MSTPLFLFLFTLKCLAAQPTLFHHSLLLGVTKDAQSLQYTTHFLMGTPQIPTKLLVDLSGQTLSVTCAPSSSTRQFISHDSLPCLMANTTAQTTVTPTICHIRQENPVTGAATFVDLADDMVTFDGITVDKFLFSCSPEYLIKGLASGAKGVLGLGRSKISFQSQLVNNLDHFPRKFTVCLSSSDGFITSGAGSGTLFKSLSYTPLVSPHGGGWGYYVNVNSIKVNRRRVVLGEAMRGVEISTTVPYTTMNSRIYGVFTKAYIKAATSMKMMMVTAVAPFGVCFASQATVPEIALVLQSEVVQWKIHSMVEVSDSVMCLGFVDGGLGMSSSMVIGGYQLEDNILEFDLATGIMGFSSLSMKGNSCSKIRSLISAPKESL